MNFAGEIKNAVFSGYIEAQISVVHMITVLAITFVLACYIFFIYRIVASNTFYDRSFNVSMAIISVVTAGIVLAMQSNIVISLSMVGALSLIRFRTAIKEPMDLLFLFWSIGTGIICGTRLYILAIILAVMVTAGIIVLHALPAKTSPYLLVVNAGDVRCEQEIMRVMKKIAKNYRIDSKNITNTGLDLIFEVRTKDGDALVNSISAISGVNSASLLYHGGMIKS